MLLKYDVIVVGGGQHRRKDLPRHHGHEQDCPNELQPSRGGHCQRADCA